MKIIVTKLGTSWDTAGKGRVDFRREDEVIHTEEFFGRIEGGVEISRLVDLSPGVQAKFVSINGPFEGRIEE